MKSMQEFKKEVEDQRNSGQHPALIKFWEIFLQQPMYVGSCADDCRQINLNNPKDKHTFITWVKRDIERLKQKTDFIWHNAIDQVYKIAYDFLFL